MGGAPRDTGSGPVAWSFADTEGNVHSNATAAGEPALLFFMASWCGTCRGKTPMLARVHADWSHRASFYSIAFDGSDNRETLERWKRQNANPWPHGTDAGFAVQRAFGITSQSSVVVIGPDGTIVQKWGYGTADEGGLRAALTRASAG